MPKKYTSDSHPDFGDFAPENGHFLPPVVLICLAAAGPGGSGSGASRPVRPDRVPACRIDASRMSCRATPDARVRTRAAMAGGRRAATIERLSPRARPSRPPPTGEFEMIAVSSVSMRYGTKVLFDDVTTTFQPGRRYGLTGPNGAGKSTFMKLLTGELPPQRGHGHHAGPPRRAAPGPVRVRRVPRHRHRDHGQRARSGRRSQERDALYAKDALSDADGMRLGELEGTIGEHDGYSAESDAAVLLARARHPRRRARAEDERAAGRPEGPRAAGAGALRPSRSAAARRTDQPPRPRLDSLAGATSCSATTARWSSSRTTATS